MPRAAYAHKPRRAGGSAFIVGDRTASEEGRGTSFKAGSRPVRCVALSPGTVTKLLEKAHEVVQFTTLAYALFLALVFAVSWLLGQRVRLRLWFLLGASYFFYAQWDPRFLALIFAS